MAQIKNNDDAVLVTADDVWNCGDMRLAEDGRVGVVLNMKPVADGEVATLKTKGHVSAPAGEAMSAGDVVAVDITAQEVYSSGTAYTTDSGTLLYDVAEGALAVFDLNEFPYTAPS